MHTTTAALEFPFQDVPKPGEVAQVRPGLWWARMPLPFRLNHVNLWLLEEADSWTVIDAGADTPVIYSAWRALAATLLREKPLNRIVTTHGHVDHVGAAVWLMRTLGATEFHATALEWHSSRTRYLDAQRPPNPDFVAFMTRHGCGDMIDEDMVQDLKSIVTNAREPPDSFIRLAHGEKIAMGGREWKIIMASGHAEGHASFYCEHDRILIAGDQILDKITPFIGVFPTEPLADPLSEYLDCMDRFHPLHEETLVLPSHGRPFFGLHRRIKQLTNHHENRLKQTVELVGSPQSARSVANSMFREAMRTGHGRLAIGETLAHLHRLLTEGRARRIHASPTEILFQAT